HIKMIQGYIDLGFNEIYIHNVARTQEAFIDAYGKHVIPALKWPS
ncbi:MAG: LLM class F420-dependent oxidoreductase, partial [Thermomicrobiales bacterium]|nr:LLM class F420-dependent oxidoreductase [Thermomicrobiales bacterium]